MLRQLTSFGDEVREDEPLPFVESRETPLDADADVNPRITRRKSPSVYPSDANRSIAAAPVVYTDSSSCLK